MVSSHVCDNSCMEKIKLRNQSVIKCFGCGHAFNIKCFEKVSSAMKSMIPLDTNLIFVCGKCHLYLSQQKPSSTARRSSVQKNSSNTTTTIANPSHYGSTSSQTEQQQQQSSVPDTPVDANTELLRTILSQVSQLTERFDIHRDRAESSSSITHSVDDSSMFDLYRKFEKLQWDSVDIINKKIDNNISDYHTHLNSAMSNLTDKMNCVESAVVALDHRVKFDNDVLGSRTLKTDSDFTHEPIGRFVTNIPADSSSNDISLDIGSSTESINIQSAVNNSNSKHVSNISNNSRFVPDGIVTLTPQHLSTKLSPIIDLTKLTQIDTTRLKKRWFEFYLTKFSPNTTADMILEYMRENGVNNLHSTRVNALVPRNKDKSSLTFISFKIATSDVGIANVITGTSFWPLNCSITKFVDKSIIDLSQVQSIQSLASR